MNPQAPHPKSLAARLAKAQQVDGGDPRLVSLTEAAARLRVGASVMKRLVREEKIKTVKIGHSRRVVLQSLDQYIESLMK